MSCCFTEGKKPHRKRGPKSAALKVRNQNRDIPKAISSPQYRIPTADVSGPSFEEEIRASFSELTSRDVDALILQLNENEEFEWSGGHRLSAIIERLEEESRRDSTSTAGVREFLAVSAPRLRTLNRDFNTLSRHLRSPSCSKSQSYSNSHSRTISHSVPSQTSQRSQPSARSQPLQPIQPVQRPSMSGNGKGVAVPGVRPIEPPPRDLASISRIDASLVFEHFTTQDAWLLGSSLRERLMPIATPVVIDISLANQNQTLFHACTHSGVMPDNDTWVARKRKTVLRWGCSTWYMHCKFGGDEVAFAEKYGLGPDAGSYAIHGGGVPIRVVGVEGVVAVVVVSGLKQHEDHSVVVEVIKELYY